MRFKLLLLFLAALAASAAPITSVTGSITGTLGSDSGADWTLAHGRALTTNVNGSNLYLTIPNEGFSGPVDTDIVATTLYFHNNSINFGQDFSTPVTFRIDMVFSAPSGLNPPQWTLPLSVFDTGISAADLDDTLNLPAVNSFTPTASVTLNGWTYTLAVQGWRDHTTQNSITQLKVDEFSSGGADLMVRVNTSQATPEPATTSMFLLGLGALVAVRKFRR